MKIVLLIAASMSTMFAAAQSKIVTQAIITTSTNVIAPEDDDGNATKLKPISNQPNSPVGNTQSSKSPLAGALDGFNPEELEDLKFAAADIVEFARLERWDDAFATYDNISDNDKRVAVWSLLAANSSIRTKLKQICKEKGV